MITFRTIDIYGLWNKIDKIQFNLSDIIPRFQTKQIQKRLKENYIEVITGPRQSGKTTLLFIIIDFLLKNDTDKNNICYINLDTIQDYKLFENPRLFIENIQNTIKTPKVIYIFIDEIQRLKNSGLFLKGIYDLKQNIKLYISGSSSLELKSKTKEFLTGRKRETVLLPLSFKEIIIHSKKIPENLFIKLNKKNLNKWKEYENLYNKYLTEQLHTISVFGTYPEVVIKKNLNDKIESLNELYNSYIKKDIVDFIKIEKSEVFNNLVKVLSNQIGNLLNKSEIGSHIQLNAATLNHYLSVLKDTYVTYYLPPFTTNRRNEVKSAHKCFFFDNGLRNFSLKNFSMQEFRTDIGMLYENLVFTELFKQLTFEQELFFWRTKSGAEVDFVLKTGTALIPIEVKSGSIKNGTISKSYHSFIEHFQPKFGIVLNKDVFAIETIKNCKIHYIPTHWFLLYQNQFL